ncbi:hypothetical protein NC653_005978 [Populus alba x Populus x berolinensis]|uniref:Endoplasmic reticulum-Golgi intermediate compartment protein 3 n=1 Tax=Populus alba x Populus x berolinensis TaxID=444605 RepID=A0AAD6RDG7_9ROSI|nr:hypothetical protein NC653_005978 [Populus alba x Populus x berolinensis]
MDGLMSKLRNFDAYPKINEDFYSRTLSGGVITLASSIVMFLLFFSELRLYLHAVTETKLVVDTSRGETLRINLDVAFPALPCSILSLDAMDISGEQHLDVKHDIIKKRLDSHGNVIEARQDGIGAPKIEKPLQRHGGRLEHNETYCGSCYGAETTDEDCCNSCEEVREAYQKKGWAVTNPDLMDQCKREGFLQRIKDEEGEGCNIYGFLEVNKVAGNFHFAPGKSFQQSGVHVHDLLAFQKDSFNVSHDFTSWLISTYGISITDLVFAKENEPINFFLNAHHVMIDLFASLAFAVYYIVYAGISNSLFTFSVQWTQETPSGMYQYFIKVVPTVYTDVSGHTIQSNQFSVTEHFRGADIGRLQSLPGVFFFYDLCPIKVTFTEEHVSFLHFLTNVCAIVGGVFTVSGILDSFIYHGQKAIKKKMEIGFVLVPEGDQILIETTACYEKPKSWTELWAYMEEKLLDKVRLYGLWDSHRVICLHPIDYKSNYAHISPSALQWLQDVTQIFGRCLQRCSIAAQGIKLKLGSRRLDVCEIQLEFCTLYKFVHVCVFLFIYEFVFDDKGIIRIASM